MSCSFRKYCARLAGDLEIGRGKQVLSVLGSSWNLSNQAK